MIRPLSTGETHVWEIDLAASATRLVDLQNTLSTQEQDIASRYRNRCHRERYIVAHGALRNLLSGYCEQPPHDLRFSLSDTGKPSLAPSSAYSPIQFSLSHSADRALVAVSRTRIVGIDIEKVDEGTEVVAIAERFFSSDEIDVLRSAAETNQIRLFYQMWVCKEAYLKARGEGILDRLADISVSIDDSSNAVIVADSMDADAPSVWHVRLLDSSPGFCSAVAVSGKQTAVRQMPWSLH